MTDDATERAAPRSAMDTIAHVLAVWFGCGHVPIAPGTAGSLGAIPLYLGLRMGGAIAVGAGAIVVTLVGVWAASSVARVTKKKDPQIVVIDEVAGMLVTLLPAPGVGWRELVAGFVLFRIFDQFKPWPARWAERTMPSGWGIVMDDVFAGVWGAACIAGLRVANLL